MLTAAFFSAAIAAVIGLGLARAAGGHRRVAGAVADPRACLDHLSRQPADLGRGDQLSRRRPDGRDRARLVRPGRPHAAAVRAMRGSTRSTCPSPKPIGDVPVLGPIYAELISGHTHHCLYRRCSCVPLTWWLLFRTRFGLRLRAVGENPAAVDTAGISVVRLRFAAVVICGILCGIAGAYLATALQAGFVKDMTRGARLHRAGGADLRQVAAVVCAVRLPAVRLA